MPSVAENIATWDGRYDWSRGGEEWSGWWGTSAAQWRWTLLPRLAPYLPSRRSATARILEIAPGFGRWTGYLLRSADQYWGVDISNECVEACRKRFDGVSYASFHQGSGRSLEVVADNSADLVFSFDALVHVELDVLHDYIAELARVLATDGVAFIHHSVAGDYGKHFEWWRSGKKLRLRHMLSAVTRGLVDHLEHWRGTSVTSVAIQDSVRSAGLVVVSQERFPWGTRRLIDGITVIARPGSRWAQQGTVTVENRALMKEARHARAMSRLPDHERSTQRPSR